MFTPLETAIIQSEPFRRLAGIHKNGAAYLWDSRICRSTAEHTLNLLGIVKTLAPRDIRLHCAALLHDIGHIVFSHAAEQLFAVEGYKSTHLKFTEEIVESRPISAILRGAGIDPGEIVDIILAKPPNLIANRWPDPNADRIEYFFADRPQPHGVEFDFGPILRELRIGPDTQIAPMSSGMARLLAQQSLDMFVNQYGTPAQAVLQHSIYVLLRLAHEAGVISDEDLMTTDSLVLSKIAHSELADRMRFLGAPFSARHASKSDSNFHFGSIKLRVLDPLLVSGERYSDTDAEFREKIRALEISTKDVYVIIEAGEDFLEFINTFGHGHAIG